MALNNPYINAVQHETNVLCKQHAVDTIEAKSTEERATSTSGFPLIKHQVDHKDTLISKKISNSIRPTNDVRENDNKVVLSDLPFPPHPVINESSSSLSNQDNHDLLARPSSLSTQTNDPKPSHPNSDRNQPSFYEPAVSHIPIMSSSSSSSSLSVPTPTIVAPTPEHRVTFAPETITNEFEPVDGSCSNEKIRSDKLFFFFSFHLENPRTRPILVGKETLIEIDRGQLGLGLSVVGGSDTQLVKEMKSRRIFVFLHRFCFSSSFFSRRLLFTTFTMVVLHNVMVDYKLAIKFLKSIRLTYVQPHMTKLFKH